MHRTGWRWETGVIRQSSHHPAPQSWQVPVAVTDRCCVHVVDPTSVVVGIVNRRSSCLG